MKKKLLDRRGAAIELAIMMMVFSVFITTIVLTTALLQNEHKTKAELGIKQDIFLEQLGEDFVDAVLSGNLNEWEPEYNGATIPQETVVTHIWESVIVKPTCQAEGYTLHTCILCGETKKTDTKPLEKHSVISFGEGYKSEVVDCIKTETGKCRACGEIVDVATPAHSWGDYITIDPTCTTDGHKIRTCTECGEIDKEIVTAALGHTQGEKISETLPNCTEDGVIFYRCTVCNQPYKEFSQEATGHNYNTVTDEPTQSEHGQETKSCTCGDTQTVVLHNWVDGEVITQPTCTEKGMKNQVCTVPNCGATQGVEIEATKHDFDDADICIVCGINKEEIRYSLIVIKLKNGDYMLQVDALKGNTSEPIEDETVEGDVPAEENGAEPPEEADICPAGGTLVLKVTVSNLAETYTITEWSKK